MNDIFIQLNRLKKLKCGEVVKCHQAVLCMAKWMSLLFIRLHCAATHIQNTFKCSLVRSKEEVLSFRDDYFNFMEFFLMEFYGFDQTRLQIKMNVWQTSE